jgi:hypothetical protein
MPQTGEIAPLYPNVTERSLRLAAVYFPILVECANRQELIYYGGLVDQAKALHPDNHDVQNAIPVSTGRVLDVIRTFCLTRDLPNLASLVVSRGTGEPGDHFVDRHKATELQQQAFAFDWPAHAVGFETHIVEAIGFVTLKPRKREMAEQMRWTYYQTNKAQLPANIRDYQEGVLALLMEGYEPADAFAMAPRQ